MRKALYLECYSGISGDMAVAALLDLGADREVLETALSSLPIGGFEVEISRVKKSGLDGCDFNVILDKNHENHDHDMEYLHGQKQHLMIKRNDKWHHPHRISINHNHGDNEHRGPLEIFNIINDAHITDNAKEIAKSIFTIIAKAEAKAHGVEINQVHFHEVGAVDSIVDIIAVAVCIDNLGIKEVIVPQLHEGYGFVRCRHGVIPIPVPAVTHIVADNNLNLHITNTEGEMVTPTGAAIVAAIKTSDKLPEKFTIKKIGIGCGKRSYDRPSFLRAMIIEDKSLEEECIYKLESNIDDSTGEALGFVMDKLFEAGARDVHYIPVYMKKNRPAYQINVICKKEDIEKLEQIIFMETTTIGIRRIKMERSVLNREIKTMQTSLGEVQVKECNLELGKRVYPEYSSVVELCKKHNMSYQDVYHLIRKECEKDNILIKNEI
ncbi:nickel pincer cofactor biosynthesis protein LarC [Clostridium celatum]|uniref:nickel pincer cofactor biosynthesis protein LarC n=1 Tax=Clostridium celatum TaxID=36834 RepID=UPI0029102728|nr:nickel pincer cofactor biosynthesis protein LarC [Clostridium celatum]MDU6295400.1 nickel pincer cofactor biosynthesis protein LarC [Clostridium celatum]